MVKTNTNQPKMEEQAGPVSSSKANQNSRQFDEVYDEKLDAEVMDLVGESTKADCSNGTTKKLGSSRRKAKNQCEAGRASDGKDRPKRNAEKQIKSADSAEHSKGSDVQTGIGDKTPAVGSVEQEARKKNCCSEANELLVVENFTGVRLIKVGRNGSVQSEVQKTGIQVQKPWRNNNQGRKMLLPFICIELWDFWGNY